MNLSELRKSPHLSASAVSLYLDCSLAYKFRYLDDLEPESLSEGLVLGSAIHETLAEFYMGLMMGEKPGLEAMNRIFETHLRRKAHQDEIPIQYKPGKSLSALLTEGKGLLAAFSSKLDVGDAAVVAVEEAGKFEVAGVPVPILYVMDLVLEDPQGVVTIVDHKTTARAYSAKDVDENFQATVYSMAARANGFGHRGILFRFDCLIKAKNPRFEICYTARTPEDEHRAARIIKAVWDGIQKQVFVPNTGSWKCGGCGYATACKRWLRDGYPG